MFLLKPFFSSVIFLVTLFKIVHFRAFRFDWYIHKKKAKRVYFFPLKVFSGKSCSLKGDTVKTVKPYWAPFYALGLPKCYESIYIIPISSFLYIRVKLSAARSRKGSTELTVGDFFDRSPPLTSPKNTLGLQPQKIFCVILCLNIFNRLIRRLLEKKSGKPFFFDRRAKLREIYSPLFLLRKAYLRSENPLQFDALQELSNYRYYRK